MEVPALGIMEEQPEVTPEQQEVLPEVTMGAQPGHIMVAQPEDMVAQLGHMVVLAAISVLVVVEVISVQASDLVVLGPVSTSS